MRMTKPTLWLLVACLGLLSSCIEIREKVFLKRDGSGTFTLTVDMSTMRDMMTSMGVDLDDMDESPFEGMESEFEAQKTELDAIRGVSNSRAVTDKDAYTISILFDFDNIDALNAGVNKVFAEEGERPDDIVYYKYSRNRFERTDHFQQAEKMKEEIANSDDLQGMDPTALFSDMNYTTVFEFERSVKRFTNENATLSSDNKTVTFKYYFFKEGYENHTVDNVISF